jgi:hypothetical protein
MRRTLLLASPLVLAAAAGLFFFWPHPAPGGPQDKPAAEPPSARAAALPITQVVLFSSGVGYFQREGPVEGTQRVDLSFPATDVNDLLKSLVVRDLDGGHVTAVSYDSNAPVERTLQSFALNLQGNPPLAGLLNQARGEKVEVALLPNAAQPGVLTGSVIGVEKQRQPAGKDGVVEVDVLNLWCADGLRALKLAEVQRVRFLNPLLEGELKKALEALAQSHDAQKKAVSLTCAGEGRRNVRVGYVVETPVWKTSYRLVLAREKEGKPYLQGWAVVENPSDEDWRDVRMALVSGRPVSFRMDLYTPLFVPRPLVEPELFASLRPPEYSGRMDVDRLADTRRTRDREEALPLQAGAQARQGKAGGVGGKFGLKTDAKGKERPTAGEDLSRDDGVPVQKEAVSALGDLTNTDVGGSVVSVASAAKLGGFFRYAINHPVTLPRQKSALLPIAGADVEGARVSVYNERTHARFPLLGLRFKNTSGLHLMQGPVTVFEGSSYAGDGRLPDLQPGEERLVAFAVDLGTEVSAVPASDNGRLTQVKAVKGILHTTTKLRETRTYTVANRNTEDRTVLIEHPRRHGFNLVDDQKPVETAADVYRFEVKVPAGKTETKAVTEEQVISQLVQLAGLGDDQVRFFQSATAASPAVNKALQKALELRGAVQRTQQEVQELERQLKAITDDQARLRANLKEMPPTAAAYKRYLEKFDQQETQIEKLQDDAKKLQATQHQQQKALDDYLANLTAE